MSAWHIRTGSKYRARRTTIDGVGTFDSAREASRYRLLARMQADGEICQLERQVPYALHAVNPDTGELVQVGSYRADFRYVRPDGQVVVEDVKGMATLPLAKWKQKHLRGEYGIVVEEVR